MEYEPQKVTTFYDVLGVPLEASNDVLHRAWRLLAREHHPDLVNDPDESLMRIINEAYQTLRDPRSRRRYDLEYGLLEARCSRCGQPGSLRLGRNSSAVAVCGTCWVPEAVVISL